jgi:hypothetical protein
MKQKVKRVRGVTLKKLCLHGLPPDAKDGNIGIGKAPIAVTTKTQLWSLELEMSGNV